MKLSSTPDPSYTTPPPNELPYNESEEIYECHERLDEYRHFMTNAQFWLEGVLLLVIGVFGMAGNVMTIIVLRRIDANATFSFNRLLMSLGNYVNTHIIFVIGIDFSMSCMIDGMF